MKAKVTKAISYMNGLVKQVQVSGTHNSEKITLNITTGNSTWNEFIGKDKLLPAVGSDITIDDSRITKSTTGNWMLERLTAVGMAKTLDVLDQDIKALELALRMKNLSA